jgi:hypothetical protein
MFMAFLSRDPMRRIVDLERRMLTMEQSEDRLRALEIQTSELKRHVEECEALGRRAVLDRARMRKEARLYTIMIMVAVVPQFVGFLTHLVVSHPF